MRNEDYKGEGNQQKLKQVHNNQQPGKLNRKTGRQADRQGKPKLKHKQTEHKPQMKIADPWENVISATSMFL